MKQILGRKLGMTQIFNENGEIIPVTVIEAGPCVVTQVKTNKKDGYEAVQVGFEDAKEKRVNKPQTGHFKKNGISVKKHLAEFKGLDGEYNPGDTIGVDSFEKVEFADISGISVGKGFAGVIKRWNFSGGPASHGSHSHRIGGSIGSSASPARVFKGRKMAGQMGNKKVTVQNLKIVKIDAEQNLLLVEGGVPGPKGNLLRICESIKAGKKD